MPLYLHNFTIFASGNALFPDKTIVIMKQVTQIPKEGLLSYLKEILLPYDLSGDTRSRLISSARHLLVFMEKRHLDFYNEDVGNFFTSTITFEKGVGARHYQRDCRMVKLLNFSMKGEISSLLSLRPSCTYQFTGDFGYYAQQYLTSDVLREKMLASQTIDTYKLYISRFCGVMEHQGVTTATITVKNINAFLDTLMGDKYGKVLPVKNFLRYLYSIGKTTLDFSNFLQHIGRQRSVPLLSYYEPDEISLIEQSIDRTGPLGKRNYAIILLGSRLGLRRSDICRLEFSNLDWDLNEINITQHKTQRLLTIPMPKEVGESLVDYILHGRPQSSSSYVFLNATPPYAPISASLVTRTVSDAMREARIDLRGRHHSAHSLRHSLAAQLLKENVSVHVISSLLGHSTSASTMPYLSVDKNMLLRCSLDVPQVPNSFYEQKGGVLYGR